MLFVSYHKIKEDLYEKNSVLETEIINDFYLLKLPILKPILSSIIRGIAVSLKKSNKYKKQFEDLKTSTIAGDFDVCNNGYRRCWNNCRLGNNGWYYLKNGEVCNRCDQNGNEKCGICAGLGDSYYKYCNNYNR